MAVRSERVVRLRPRPRGLVIGFILVLVVAWLVPQWWIRAQDAGWLTALLAAAAAVLVVGCVLPWLVWLTRTVTINDDDICVRRGLLRRSTWRVPLGEVKDIRLHAGLFERLTGCASIDILDERGRRFRIAHVPFGDGLQEVLEHRVAPARARLDYLRAAARPETADLQPNDTPEEFTSEGRA